MECLLKLTVPAIIVRPARVRVNIRIREIHGDQMTIGYPHGVKPAVVHSFDQHVTRPVLRGIESRNAKSVHGVLNPTYQAGLRRDAVHPDIEAERKKRDEIEAGKSNCSRRFGGATCDDKSAQIYARFDKNDWRTQPAEFYRLHDAEVNTFGYF